jgi:ATP-binding cassette subfamily B protein
MGEGRANRNDIVDSILATPAIATGAARRSVYDQLRVPPERRSLRELPKLVHGSLRLAWVASPRLLIVSVVLQAASAVALLAQLLVARHLLAAIVVATRSRIDFERVLPDLVAIAALTAAVALAGSLGDELSMLMGELMSRQGARELLDVAAAVDLEAYDVTAFHDRLERARLNLQSRPASAVNSLLGVLSGALTAVGLAAGLVAIQPLILPVAAFSIVPIWWATSRNTRAYHAFALEMTPNDRARSYAQGVLTSKDSAKEVRAFEATRFFRERFDSLFDSRLAALRRVVRARIRRSLLGSFLSAVLVATGIAFLVWVMLRDRTSLASTGTATLGIVYLGQRMRAMMGSVTTLYESALFIDDYTLFLDLRADVDTGRDAETAAAPGRIVVDDVSFTYHGASQPALDGVSLEIEAGEVVALVGDNGSGKTTLAKLLGLLYRPQTGRIWWDRLDTASGDLSVLRRCITVIFQDFGRYWISARENIGIAAPERADDDDAIRRAAVAVDADSFLSSLPYGYDTVLSQVFEGGRELSHGQWQRVALARALFRDAPLVILDEPTASLDAMSEYRLFQVIRDVCAGRSVLLISHRFSSVRNADRIYVLDAGRVVESGTHDELMAQAGRYAHMFTLQASSYVGT